MNQEIESKIEWYIKSALNAEFVADFALLKKRALQPPEYVSLVEEFNAEVRRLTTGIHQFCSCNRRLKQERLTKEAELKSMPERHAPVSDKLKRVSTGFDIKTVVGIAAAVFVFGFAIGVFCGTGK